ncbi:MAG: DUF362 domain-containing protein [Candidatus Aminicenantia bacterium]
MERRKFIEYLAFGSIFPYFKDFASAPSYPDLSIVESDSPYLGARVCVELLGGMKRFISRGDVVVIKPNIGWDRRPELGANTNPEVVKAIAEMCFDAGAKKVIVIDNSVNDPRRCYTNSGIINAVKGTGAETPFPNPKIAKKIKIGGEWIKEWKVLPQFLEADKIINVPVAKNHSLSILTLGMKNWLGAIGGERNRLHQRIHEAVNDLSAFFKPALTILDAWRIMIRNGPTGGSPGDVVTKKTIVAGKDFVAVDTFGAEIFGKKVGELPFLMIAKQRGLGETHLERLKLEKKRV